MGILIVGTLYLSHTMVFLAPTHVLQVSFLDVGQGDAIYIRTPNGNDVLIDGGPDDQVIQKLYAVMPLFDKDIDLVIETHPDKDHIAGLIPVFENYKIRQFLHSEVSSGTSFDIQLNQSIKQELGVEVVTARTGQRFILDSKKGIYLDVLFPDQNTTHFTETNDASIIVRLVYGNHSFLLTGDASASIEQFLARNTNISLQSTVLKLGHHGSKTSSSDEFIRAVQPDYAIVSAGKNNSYGHPHTQVMERLHSRTIPVLSTQTHGTITFISNGATLWTK